MRSALELPREYNIIKANYFYKKVEEDIKKWLTEIDWMIKANNVIIERKVAVVVVYLRNIVAN